MAELESVDLGFGTLSFVQFRPETETRTERDGDTTINYMGTPGRAAYCEVSYMVTCNYKTDDDTFSNFFNWTVRLPGSLVDAPYSESEAEGARRIAPMLRAVADGIEKRVSDFDASREQEKAEGERYLIERISWMCRDYRRHVPEGDGRVKLIFSRRGGMSYDDFRAYLHRLQDADDPEIRIHWPVIDIDGLEALDHSQRYGLQVADLSISGLRAAVEYDLYGNLEPRFAETLKGNVYAHKGNFLSYGAKAVPPCDAIAAHQQDGVKTANMSHWLRIFG